MEIREYWDYIGDDIRQIVLVMDDTPKTVSFYKPLGFTEFSETGCCVFMRC